MNRHEEIRNAYRISGNNSNLYDGMMTYSTPLGKAICNLVWNMNGERNAAYLEQALSPIPENFDGKLLEVPVGTGVLSMPVYRTLPNADITCLDYSEDMMNAARQKAEQLSVNNVTFVQGDVGKLPFEDESFDIVLSLNGFHAFPDKEAAYKETMRVLKPKGTFCGCFYIKGANRRTDWIIANLYEKMGFFTPPYETEFSLRQRLHSMYSDVRVSHVEGIGVFDCVK